MRTFIVRAFEPVGLVAMCHGNLYQNTKRIRNWPALFLALETKALQILSRYIVQSYKMTILQCLSFPEICWILRERQPPKLPVWSLSAMLERQFLPVPCWVLLSSLSFCYWLSHLLHCCPWKNISLQEPPAALNSKGYNDTAAWISISFSTFCICQLLTSSRSSIVRLKKGGSSVFSIAFVWRLPGQIRPWKPINSMECLDIARRAEKNSAVILKKLFPVQEKFPVASGFLRQAFLINRGGRYHLLFSEITIICLKYQQHWKSCKGWGYWPGFHCSSETIVDL